VLDALAGRFGIEGDWKTKDGARQILDRTRGVVLVAPQTFMNASGEPTGRIAAWYKIPPEHILVIVDDLDLPFGKLRMRQRGSSGGHNGLKSLIAVLGEDFPRLRIGIGRDGASEAIDRVLSPFTPEEEARFEPIVDACVRGVLLWLDEPAVTAINFVNSFSPPHA
jgi:PTH1 family peptidyl-tRNA hydrolase